MTPFTWGRRRRRYPRSSLGSSKRGEFCYCLLVRNRASNSSRSSRTKQEICRRKRSLGCDMCHLRRYKASFEEPELLSALGTPRRAAGTPGHLDIPLHSELIRSGALVNGLLLRLAHFLRP